MTSQWRQRQTRSTSRVASSSGYALPAVLMLSTALLIMGLAIAQSSLAIRQALLNQYYTHLANEAAQAGIVYAQDCLSQNANVAQWTTLKPLKPNTDCTGTPLCGNPTPACTSKQLYLVSTNGVQTSFSVLPPDSSQSMTSSGSANLVTTTGSQVRSYAQTAKGTMPMNLVKQLIVRGCASALRTDGSLWTWGSGTCIGNGSANSTPVKQTMVISSGVKNVFGLNTGTMFALKTDGTLWAWGYNNHGQVGNNSTTDQTTPVQIMSGVSQVEASSSYNAYAIRTDGSLWSWGSNGSGAVGDGTTTDRLVPYQIISSGVASIRAGIGSGDDAYAIKTNGSLWGWGDRTLYLMGDGGASYGYQTTPEQIIASGVSQALPGATSMYVIETNGSLWGWGYESNGEIGNGALTGGQNTPYQIISSGVSQFTNAITTNYVIKTDGSLWAWGKNSAGQVGNNSTIDRTTPVQVIASGVSQFQASPWDYNAYALKTNASVWAWGDNTYGQVGNGTTTNVLAPVSVISSGVAQLMSNKVLDTYAIKTDGSLWDWGYNGGGQIGNGTTTNQLVPYMVIPSGVIQVPPGGFDSYALKSDGSAYAWGANSAGEDGDGTTNSLLTPYLAIPPPTQPPIF